MLRPYWSHLFGGDHQQTPVMLVSHWFLKAYNAYSAWHCGSVLAGWPKSYRHTAPNSFYDSLSRTTQREGEKVFSWWVCYCLHCTRARATPPVLPVLQRTGKSWLRWDSISVYSLDRTGEWGIRPEGPVTPPDVGRRQPSGPPLGRMFPEDWTPPLEGPDQPTREPGTPDGWMSQGLRGQGSGYPAEVRTWGNGNQCWWFTLRLKI